MIITHKHPLYRAYIGISPESIGSRMLPTVGGLGPITREATDQRRVGGLMVVVQPILLNP